MDKDNLTFELRLNLMKSFFEFFFKLAFLLYKAKELLKGMALYKIEEEKDEKHIAQLRWEVQIKSILKTI